MIETSYSLMFDSQKYEWCTLSRTECKHWLLLSIGTEKTRHLLDSLRFTKVLISNGGGGGPVEVLIVKGNANTPLHGPNIYKLTKP